MKVRARIISGQVKASGVSGKALTAAATPMRGVGMKAAKCQDDVELRAWPMPDGIHFVATTTEKSGLHRFLRVTPVEPQHLVWLVPQVGVDYTVTTSTDLKWEIK